MSEEVYTVAARLRLCSTREVDPIWQPQLPRVWSDNLEQTSTGFVKHRHQGTSVALSAGYLSVRSAYGGGVSDRC